MFDVFHVPHIAVKYAAIPQWSVGINGRSSLAGWEYRT